MEQKSRFSRFLHFPVTKIFLGLAGVVAAVMLMQFGTETILKYTGSTDDFKNLVVAVLVSAAALATYVYLFIFYEKRKIGEISTRHFLRNLFIGFSTGFIILTIVILIMYFGNAYTILAFHPLSYLVPALSLGISSAIFEELLFRGIIFRITEEKLGSVWALVISSSIFGLAHLANDNSTIFSAVAISVEAGFLLGAAYIYSKNLWLPIWIHFAWNFSEGGIYGAIISGTGLNKSLIRCKISGPDLLTGGAFGPENSLQAVILGLLTAGLFLWLAKKRNHMVKPAWRRQLEKE